MPSNSSQSARDRDRLRQEQLARQGGRFHRFWSSEWFHDKEKCATKAVAAYHEAVQITDEQPPPSRTTDERPAHAREPWGKWPSWERIQAEPSVPQRTEARPWAPRGYPIVDYSDDQLTRLAQWVRSDGNLRTEDELLDEIMRDLGFQRRGKNVVARITDAIRRSRPGDQVGLAGTPELTANGVDDAPQCCGGLGTCGGLTV